MGELCVLVHNSRKPPQAPKPATATELQANIPREVAARAGEAAGARALLRAGYQQLPSKLPGNRGFDGVFVKYGKGGIIDDIIIVESKFRATGWASLAWTKTMGQQMSWQWIDANIAKMLASNSPVLRQTAHTLERFGVRNITRKVNVLDASGVNRWFRVAIPG